MDTGVLTPANKDGNFYFWPVQEGYEEHGLEPLARFPASYSMNSLNREVEEWAKIHTEQDEYFRRFGCSSDNLTFEYFLERFGTGWREYRAALRETQKLLQTKLGVVISFRPNIAQLPIEVEWGWTEKEWDTQQQDYPICLHRPEGIDSSYVLYIEPLGKKDREILQEHVGDIVDI